MLIAVPSLVTGAQEQSKGPSATEWTSKLVRPCHGLLLSDGREKMLDT